MASSEQAKENLVPLWMLEEGLRDPELEGAHLRAKPVPIFAEGKIIGWHTPRKEKLGWRVGAIYIDPAYRGQGHGKRVVQKFFANRRAAPVPIREGNLPSESTFRSAGFEPTDRMVEDDDGWVGRWWERPEVKKKSGYTDLHRRVLSKEAGRIDQMKPTEAPSTKMSEWTRSALLQYRINQGGHNKLSKMRPSPQVAHLLQKAGLVDRPQMSPALKTLLAAGAGVAGAVAIPPALALGWLSYMGRQNQRFGEELAASPTFQAARHANEARFAGLKGLSNRDPSRGGLLSTLDEPYSEPVAFDAYSGLGDEGKRVHLTQPIDPWDTQEFIRSDARTELDRQRPETRPFIDKYNPTKSY